MSTKQVHNKFKDEQKVFCLAFAELFILSDSFNTLNPFYDPRFSNLEWDHKFQEHMEYEYEQLAATSC